MIGDSFGGFYHVVSSGHFHYMSVKDLKKKIKEVRGQHSFVGGLYDLPPGLEPLMEGLEKAPRLTKSRRAQFTENLQNLVLYRGLDLPKNISMSEPSLLLLAWALNHTETH